jgi:type I restriction enzyme S subunit
MAGEWETAPLSELCEQIADCPHSTPLWTNSGVIVLRNQNIRGGRLDLSSPSYTDEEHFEQRSRRARLKEGDLVLTREAPMGEVCMVPENLRCCLGQRMVMLRPDPKKCDSRFLLYSIQSDAVQHEIKVNEGTGSTVSNLRIPLLEALPIPHPPLAEQKAIAAVLGALDDKIELNRRMNATLEAMARALFQSWFVDFDPVRAKLDGRPPAALDPATAALFPDSFEDSDLGHIPKGWEVGRLGQYLATEIGGDWGEDDRFDGAIEVAALRGVDLEHLRERGDANPPRRWIKESSLAKRRMSACDVLVASSGAGPCGRPLWVSPHLEAAFPVPVLYSNFCKRYRAATPAHALYFDRVLFEMRASGEIWDFINGTSLPNLDSNGLLTGKSVLVPPVEILEKFAAFVQPIYERLYSRQSRTLATLRDTLLPKLLSGELSVTQSPS